MKYHPFIMERWQSTYEHRVRFNLSESGVHPLSVTELLSLANLHPDTLDIRLGYGQSNGSDDLRNLIADLYAGVTEASVLVTTGAAEANFTVFWELMEPDASVAVMLPNYMQVPGLLKSFGADIHPFHLVEENGWQPDLNELEKGLKDGARFILVTNPNNPTGAVLDDTSMSGIVELADRHGAWILADEGLPRRRTPRSRDSLVLGPPRSGPRHELVIQSLWITWASDRLGGWARRDDGRSMGPHGLHDDRPGEPL